MTEHTRNCHVTLAQGVGLPWSDCTCETHDRLSAARQGLVKALEELILDATSMQKDLNDEFSTDCYEPDSLPAARAALRELEEAS